MDALFGATYIGVVGSTFLYGIMTLQTYIYWFKYVHDSTFDRWFVLILWLMDTLQSPLSPSTIGLSISKLVSLPLSRLWSKRTLLAERGSYRWLVGGWLGAAAVCDILIVYMLSHALMTQRTGFGRTDALINKILWYTINTGLLTSLIAVTDLITFCTMDNMIHLGFNFVLGKLYTNTLLATLNARDTEPTNIVHVEEGSYNLKDRQQNASHGQIRFNRPPGMTSSQDRAEPVIHLHTDTAVEISDIESRRRSSQDKVYQGRQVVVLQHGNTGYNPSKDGEFDADSVESFKKGRS
ncbi:hypothetical protein RSAG8_01921, partial [Rhizoctonia solani AG-8 WAC10335]